MVLDGSTTGGLAAQMDLDCEVQLPAMVGGSSTGESQLKLTDLPPSVLFNILSFLPDWLPKLLTVCKALTQPAINVREAKVQIKSARQLALYLKHLDRAGPGAGLRCRELRIGSYPVNEHCPQSLCALAPFAIKQTPMLNSLALDADPGPLFQHLMEGTIFGTSLPRLERLSLVMIDCNIQRLLDGDFGTPDSCKMLPSSIKTMFLAAPMACRDGDAEVHHSIILDKDTAVWPPKLEHLHLRSLDIGDKPKALRSMLEPLPHLRVLVLDFLHHLPPADEIEAALANVAPFLEVFKFRLGCYHHGERFLTSSFVGKFSNLKILSIDSHAMPIALLDALPKTLLAIEVHYGFFDRFLPQIMCCLCVHAHIKVASFPMKNLSNHTLLVKFYNARGLSDASGPERYNESSRGPEGQMWRLLQEMDDTEMNAYDEGIKWDYDSDSDEDDSEEDPDEDSENDSDDDDDY